MTVPIPADAPPTRVKGGRAFANEPVRVGNAIFTFIQAVNAVLMISEVYDARVGGIVTGIVTAAYALVSELFVRSNVVPLEPLEKLAYAQRQAEAGPATP
jgi:hypothetical protein